MKDLIFSRLLDIYSVLLTDKQNDVIRQYYDLDYSLSEIGDNCQISRQAARFAIKQAEEKLLGLEDGLQLLQKKQRLERIVDECMAICENEDLKERLLQIKEIL